MAAEHLLKGNGICRIHGGGFGGTIQVFIRNEAAADFVREMEKSLEKTPVTCSPSVHAAALK